MKQLFESGKLKALLPYFLLAVAVIGAYKIINELNTFIVFIKQSWNIIIPFFYGFLLAYVLNIPCGGIQKLMVKLRIKFIYKRKKALSIIIVYVLFLLILFLILNLVIPSVINSISLFFSNFQVYYNSAQQLIDYINELDFISVDFSMDSILNWIRNISLDNISSSLNALFGFSSAIFKGFLTFVSSIYILFEKEKFTAFLSRVLKAFSSSEVYDAIYKYANRLNKNFKRYIFAQTIDGCILGSIVTTELYFLGSPYALTLGIILGIINYIPYFGSIIGTIITIIIVAFTQGIPSALLTAVVLLITQQIDGNIIQPKLLGGSFSLSPLLVIICITIGGAFAGILGMIAAIPIIAVLKDMFDEIITYVEQKKIPKEEEY